MSDKIDKIVQKTIDNFVDYEDLLYTSLSKDYLLATVSYNNGLYSFIDCQTKFGDITEEEYLPHVKLMFIDWLAHEENNMDRDYHC